jgi:class 3 adenylate cyclase
MVTFLLTDVEGSTRLWERIPHQMSTALARHLQPCARPDP